MTTEQQDTPLIYSNKISTTRWIIPIIIILLLLAHAWSFFRIHKLEKSMQQAGSDISALKSWSSSASSDISSLFSGLNYVTPLAENANNYAHSHPYSDVQLKTDITPIFGSLDSVLAIHGVRFNWSEDAISTLNLSDAPQIGFIAQDVEKFFPEIVTIAPNSYRTVNYDELIPVLFEAIQEQQTIIEGFQARISTMEAQQGK